MDLEALEVAMAAVAAAFGIEIAKLRVWDKLWDEYKKHKELKKDNAEGGHGKSQSYKNKEMKTAGQKEPKQGNAKRGRGKSQSYKNNKRLEHKKKPRNN